MQSFMQKYFPIFDKPGSFYHIYMHSTLKVDEDSSDQQYSTLTGD